MSEEQTEAEGGEKEGAKPEKKKAKGGGGGGMLVPLLLVVNLGASGAGVFFQLTKHAVAAAAPAAEAHAEEKDKHGPVAALDPFVVNLNETSSSRYLKATFEFELADETAAKVLDKDKRAVRDEVLRYLSGLSVAETLGAENKEKIRAEIVARVDKELGGGGKVKKCFFNDFVVQ